MSKLEIIKAAKELISDPERWIQGANARNEQGLMVLAYAFDAVCWCADGALIKACGSVNTIPFWRLISDKPAFDVIEFNDNHTHAEVIALFDAAIARLELNQNLSLPQKEK